MSTSPSRPSYRRIVLSTLLLATVVFGTASLFAEPESPKKAPAEAAAAQPAGITATLQWVRRVELGTAQGGNVLEVLVEEGDRVEKGQPLLRLDAQAQEALAARADAGLRRLGAVRNEARRTARIAADLHGRDLMSDHELEQARSAAAGAEADYRAAQADAAQAHAGLEARTLRAPFDGVVVLRDAEAGQSVAPGNKPVVLLAVADSSRMRARAEVQRDALEKLKRGQQIQVKVAKQTYTGTVKTIGLEPLDGLGGQFAQYELVVEFSAPPEADLYAGQPAQLTLP